MTIYLTADDVLRINEKFCGTDQLRDFGLLDAAANRPQASAFGEDAFPTVHEKATFVASTCSRYRPMSPDSGCGDFAPDG